MHPDLYVVQAMIELYQISRRRVHKRALDSESATAHVPTDQLVLRDSLEKIGPYTMNLLKRLKTVEHAVDGLDKRGTFTELCDMETELVDPMAFGPAYQQTLHAFANEKTSLFG